MLRLALPDAVVTLHRGFFTAAEADLSLRVLQSEVAWRRDTIRMFGRTSLMPRLTAWQGDAGYTYSGVENRPSPWTPTVAATRERIEALTGRTFTGVLLNLYRDGRDSMGWHSDNEVELGAAPLIASVSLGASRRFRLRHRTKRLTHAIDLGHGDVLVMAGPTQAHWQHSLAKTTRVLDPRVNLTFRTIS